MGVRRGLGSVKGREKGVGVSFFIFFCWLVGCCGIGKGGEMD